MSRYRLSIFFWCFRPAQNYAPGQAYWNDDGIISGHDSPICRFAVGPRTACKFAARATPFFAGHRRTTGAGPSGLILASASGVSSHAGLRGALPDYGSWSKWAYSSLGSRSLCQGHSVLPLPCENRRLSMGFCRDIFFLPVRAYRRSIWVSAPASILLVLLQVGMTGNLPLLVVQSSPCSPTKAPLYCSLQKSVQPSLTQQSSRTY